MTYEEYRAEWDRILTLPLDEREEAIHKWYDLPNTEEFRERFRKEMNDKKFLSWREYRIIGDTKLLREARLLLLGHHSYRSKKEDEDVIEELWPEVVAQEAELWFFCSPSDTWQQLRGRAGYLIVKDGKILKTEVTLLN
jgi:hypothetical protein